MNRRVFIFGLGFSALAFARRIAGEAAWIGGTVRTPEKAAALAREGIETLVFDGERPGEGVAAALARATDVVISIAPGAADPVLVHHGADLMAAPELAWLGYLSTVGVYGNHDGAWIDETTTPRPERTRSRQRLAAEEDWQALADARGLPLATFRIAGIYGPGRNALANLERGAARRVVKPGQVFNRIHVDDIAAAVAAAWDRRATGIFNLADDEAAPPQDLVTFAADLMGVEPPPEVAFEDADLSPMARSFYGDNKRVRNTRIKDELGVTLRHPTYRHGLSAMWREGSWRG